LARYCGATPHIQSETRRELSVAVANCVRCNPMRNALVRTQQRKDDTELSSELKIVSAVKKLSLFRRKRKRIMMKERKRGREKTCQEMENRYEEKEKERANIRAISRIP